MSVVVKYELPSPESEFIKQAFGAKNIDPWIAPAKIHDVAICVGPVSDCPPARKKVLFIMGQTKNHSDLNWDQIIVTSDKAKTLALRKFGHGIKVRKIVPPVIGINDARNRIVDNFKGFLIHASDSKSLGRQTVKTFSLWGSCDNGDIWNEYNDLGFHFKVWKSRVKEMFSSFEYNSMIRGGAVGFYPEAMEDGYDIQVRRHLALGGRVICRQDRDVLGDNVDLDGYSQSMSEMEYMEEIRKEVL